MVRGWRLLWKHSIVANSESQIMRSGRRTLGHKLEVISAKANRSPTRKPGQASRSRTGMMGPGRQAAGSCNQLESPRPLGTATEGRVAGRRETEAQ